jgi:chromosome segregation ATPase
LENKALKEAQLKLYEEMESR